MEFTSSRAAREKEAAAFEKGKAGGEVALWGKRTYGKCSRGITIREIKLSFISRSTFIVFPYTDLSCAFNSDPKTSVVREPGNGGGIKRAHNYCASSWSKHTLRLTLSNSLFSFFFVAGENNKTLKRQNNGFAERRENFEDSFILSASFNSSHRLSRFKRMQPFVHSFSSATHGCCIVTQR